MYGARRETSNGLIAKEYTFYLHQSAADLDVARFYTSSGSNRTRLHGFIETA